MTIKINIKDVREAKDLILEIAKEAGLIKNLDTKKIELAKIENIHSNGLVDLDMLNEDYGVMTDKTTIQKVNL